MKAPLRRSDEECDGGGACDQQLAVLCRRPRLPLMNLCKLLIGSWREEGGGLFMRKEKTQKREAHLTRGHFGRREGDCL